MEKVSVNAQNSKLSTGFFQSVVLNALSDFGKGRLNLTLPSGELISFGDGEGVNAEIKINDPKFFKSCVLYGDIGFGESYCDGEWETIDLTSVIRWVIQNREASGVMSGSQKKRWLFNFLELFNKFRHMTNKNTKKGSKGNISYHYDLSNDFYKIMLDETMSYSCGVFTKKENNLQLAQEKKLQNICDDLEIQKSDHILEIGCGWGSFACYAAKKYGCRVTGVTISKEQYEFAKKRVSDEGLENLIDLKLMDYRDIEGKFDKVVSIEMIEAVGHEFLKEYFYLIDNFLKEDGVAVIQAITSPDSRYDSFRKGVDFIQKHIFPGSLLPSIGAIVKSCEKTNLHLYGLRDIGLSYATTLKTWNDKVLENKQKISELGMDENFFRKWTYYLCYCEAAFIERNISTVQLTFIKPNNTQYKYCF